jgi:hypothetical protein
VTAVVSNFDHLMSLGIWRMAAVIWNLCDDYCLFCPRNMRRACNEDCRAGIAEWLRAPYIPESEVWKEKKRK